MKTFSFPENSISGKYLFSGNAFTRTKRSLSLKLLFHCSSCAIQLSQKVFMAYQWNYSSYQQALLPTASLQNLFSLLNICKYPTCTKGTNFRSFVSLGGTCLFTITYKCFTSSGILQENILSHLRVKIKQRLNYFSHSKSCNFTLLGLKLTN